MLIGITGAKGSGKDTLGDFYRNRGFVLVKNADPLKQMMRALYRSAGLTDVEIEEKIEGRLKETPCEALLGKTPRFAMQTLGTEWREMLGRPLWSSIMSERTSKLLSEGTSVVCTDVRFQHEADVIQALGGYLIRVIRPGVDEGDSHSSETEMKSLGVDFIVSNLTSITDLQKQGKKILDTLTSKSA